jgi:hypothetical protein
MCDDRGREIADFDTFSRLYPECHLVRGSLQESLTPREIGALRRRLRGFIATMALKGDYATGLVRAAGMTELQCRFAQADDAKVVGSWLNARKVAGNGFASHRTFVVTDAVREGLKAYGRSSAGA